MASPAAKRPGVPTQPLPPVFFRYKSDIDEALRARFRSCNPIYRPLRYAMGWFDENGNPNDGAVGKALRPTLCLLACDAAGGDALKALPAAVSLELIHNFSMVHDDIQDGDKIRRNRPTLWAVWGVPKAIVAGNALRVVADMSLSHPDAEYLCPEQMVVISGLLTESYLDMIEGQYLDLSYEGRPDIGLNDYLGMISRKTGSLIRCALSIGATIGARNSEVVRSLSVYGKALGYVYQIRDDMLGIWGNEQVTGKPVGADVARRKNTFPLVYALSKAEGTDRDVILDAYRGSTVDENAVGSVIEVLDKVGAREYAQAVTNRYCQAALDSIADLALDSEDRRDLEELARFLLIRER